MSTAHANITAAPAAKQRSGARAATKSNRRCACGARSGEGEYCSHCGGLVVQRHAAAYEIGSAGDPLEREADRAADSVMSGRHVASIDGVVSAASRVQRSAIYSRVPVGSSGRIKTGKLIDWDYVVYADHVRIGNRVFDKKTKQVIGSWPWLTNNPGDITVDPKEAGKPRSNLNRAYEWGAVKDKAASTGHIPLAIFPDGATGAAALKKLYAEPEYRDKTLRAAIEVHLGNPETRVPGVDDPKKYLDRVKERARKLGVKEEILGKTLADIELAGAMDAIVEGFGAAEGYENVGVTYTCTGRDKTDDSKIPQTVRNLQLFKSLPDQTPDEVLRLLGCQVPSGDGGKAQKKSAWPEAALGRAAAETTHPGATVSEALASADTSLPEDLRRQMESRFRRDFSKVRIHTGEAARSSAEQVAAHAYTVGQHIVFADGQYAPGTQAGQRLLAHELTHVVQQSRTAAPVLRRQPDTNKGKKKPGAFYQEVIDNIAYADREMSEQRKRGELVRAPINYASLKALLTLCEAVDQKSWDTVPTRLDAFLAAGVMVPFHTISEELLAELSARIFELGLERDAQRLRKAYADNQRDFSIASADPGAGQRALQFYTRLVNGAISDAAFDTPARLAASIHQFARAFVPLRDAYASIDWKALDFERRSGHSFMVLRPGMSHEEWYRALHHEIEHWLGGLQGLIQQAIGAARADFESGSATGSGAALLVGLRDSMTRDLRDVLFPRDASNDISEEHFNTTRTTLTKGRGFISDAFDADSDKKKRRVAITTYDPDQEFVQEMHTSLTMLYVKRLEQIAVLGRIYGAMDLVPRQLGGGMNEEARENAATISKLKDGRLRLDSDDDWREFVLQKYRDLTHTATLKPGEEPTTLLKLSPAEALRAVMDVLFLYLRNFTMHAHYTNIYDIGDSYLNKPFPRALTGQLVHDCGVYAVRAAYILSLVRNELKLKFRFVFMPAHVGLVIEGENLPTYFIQNDSFSEVSPESMNAAKQNFENFTRTVSVTSSDATATITASVEAPPPGPRDHTQLIGELSAGRFINEGADMPFRVVDIPAGGTAAGSARTLWDTYEANATKGMFGPAASDKNDPGYLFHQRYLGLIEERNKQYNELMVPFWNVSGPRAWENLGDAIKPVKGEAVAASLLAPVREYAAVIARNVDALKQADTRMDGMAKSITSSLGSNPKQRRPDARIAVGERARSLFESDTELLDYRNKVGAVVKELEAKPEAQWKVDQLLDRLRPPFAPPTGVPKRPLE